MLFRVFSLLSVINNVYDRLSLIKGNVFTESYDIKRKYLKAW